MNLNKFSWKHSSPQKIVYKLLGIIFASFPTTLLNYIMATGRTFGNQHESIDKLFNLVETDPKWDSAHQEFLSAKSADDCVAIAKKHGYNFTKEQFETYFENHITPEQLEAVEGGGGCCCCCTC